MNSDSDDLVTNMEQAKTLYKSNDVLTQNQTIRRLTSYKHQQNTNKTTNESRIRWSEELVSDM